ncbi:LOW QUALITY PROTEIN: hypothetical protein ColTof3_05791 [Colletotrichum tofieldiae]|nr:LOW QUALITY PROTEIN: hypothetical protein ColTof3_05791 [Colletotrichum tofieldiae]
MNPCRKLPGRSIQQPRQAYEREVTQRRQAESQLRELKALLQQKEEELTQNKVNLTQLSRRWKKVAGELNKLKVSRKQSLHELTDPYLISKTNSLRYSIRNFAIRYFEEDFQDIAKVESSIRETKYFRHFRAAAQDEFIRGAYFGSKQGRPKIVQAFIWRVLTSEIFEQYLWAGPGLSRALQLLNERMGRG